ncbi:glycosyltransferase [Candidatus Saccharibacteria bacterium HGW-Saccharibacteria-1]|jgi:dolichol-phosphate mannosyltransferase|nr:MAG: glycosyltransferase [Candidatus Saccharibacteria bacterium HGW-Saccharibacteria-1]
MTGLKTLSIISPVYNEQDGIEWFHKELCLSLKKFIKCYEIEIIYINDGSSDGSLSKLQSLQPSNGINIKLIDLSRNFGKEAALSAGIANASGDAALTIDSDGQHPFKQISKFLKKWEDGAEVVVGVRRTNKKEGIVKKYGSKIFYKLFNKLTNTTLIPGSTDFRLIDRKVIDEFIKLEERNRITRGLIDWLGFNREYVYFDANERQFGTAGYTFKKLAELAVNTFVSLSAVPLFMSGYIGVLFIFLSLASSLFIFIEQFLLGDPMHIAISGSAILGFLTLFLIGIVLTAQGLMGVYISRLLAEGQNRPLYVIRKETEVNSNLNSSIK